MPRLIWYVDRVNPSLQLYLIIRSRSNLLKHIFSHEEHILTVKMYYVHFWNSLHKFIVLQFISYDLMVIYN